MTDRRTTTAPVCMLVHCTAQLIGVGGASAGGRVLFTTSMSSTARRLRYTGQLHSAMQPSIDSPRFSPSTRRRRYFTPRQSVLPAPERERTHASRKFDRGLGQILHDQLHWLDVPDRVLFKLAVTVHRCLNGRAPPYLSEHCVPVSSADTRRHLRSANRHLLAVPRFRLNTYGPMADVCSRAKPCSGGRCASSAAYDTRAA